MFTVRRRDARRPRITLGTFPLCYGTSARKMSSRNASSGARLPNHKRTANAAVLSAAVPTGSPCALRRKRSNGPKTQLCLPLASPSTATPCPPLRAPPPTARGS